MTTLTSSLRLAFSSRLGPSAAARLAPLASAPRAAFSTSTLRLNDGNRSAYAKGGARRAFARPVGMRQADSSSSPSAYEEPSGEKVEPEVAAERQHLRGKRSSREAAEAEEEAVDPLSTKNYDIPFEYVQLVDENAKLSKPILLGPIVDSIDTKIESVICVQADPPIVKIVNIKEQQQKERERQEKIRLSKRLAIDDKEVQVGWGAADGDVQHKIDTAVDLLKKGDRVHVIFALRASSGGKKQRVPDERKMQILEKFEEGVADVAKKWKDDEQNRGLWIQHWMPKESIAVEARAKLIEEGAEKRKARDDKKEARRQKELARLEKAKQRQAAGIDLK